MDEYVDLMVLRLHLVYEEQEDPATRSFFSEIIASISDIKFSPDGRYIIARDFLTLKIWDVNMDSRPVQTINVRYFFFPHLYCHTARIVSRISAHGDRLSPRSTTTCAITSVTCTRATVFSTSSNALSVATATTS